MTLPRWHHAADVLAGPSGQRYRVDVRSRIICIICNNQISIRQFTLAGCGLSFGVVPEMASHLEAERLIRVLPDWKAARLSVDALMLPRKAQPAKVRVAIEELRRYFGSLTSEL